MNIFEWTEILGAMNVILATILWIASWLKKAWCDPITQFSRLRLATKKHGNGAPLMCPPNAHTQRTNASEPKIINAIIGCRSLCHTTRRTACVYVRTHFKCENTKNLKEYIFCSSGVQQAAEQWFSSFVKRYWPTQNKELALFLESHFQRKTCCKKVFDPFQKAGL